MARNWSELPDLALFAILRRLSALLDLFGFAGVCRSWRSVFMSTVTGDRVTSRPSLLLCPRPTTKLEHPEPLRCHLLTLDHPSSPQSFLYAPSSYHVHTLIYSPVKTQLFDYYDPPLLSVQPDNVICLGGSHGHLILLRQRAPPNPQFIVDPLELLLADALTGAETRLPDFPRLPPCRPLLPFYYAFLTSPPSSLLLLLFYSKYELLCLRLSDGGWSTHRLRPGVSFVVHVLSFKGQVYAVNDQAKLLTIDFSPELNVKPIEVGGLHPMPFLDRAHFGPQLVESSGELMLLLFIPDERRLTRVVYRMDFVTMMWVAVESSGDHCGGRCHLSCSHPGSLACKVNCIYMPGVAASRVDLYQLQGLPGALSGPFLSHDESSSSEEE